MSKLVKQIPTWVFSWHCKKDEANCVGVKECNISLYDDGSSVHTTQLKLFKDPVRPFWVTLPEYRNHEYKKEFEDIDKCEQFLCHDSALTESVANALGVYGYRKNNLKAMCDSPYLYGADIETPVLIKMNYVRNTPPGILPVITRGMLDIESETTGDKRIVAITFIHEQQIFTAALAEYCRIHLGNDKFRTANESDCLEVIDKIIGEDLKENNFTLRFTICQSEIALIKWIFDRINECKTDLIGVWNLGYDIPHILFRIEQNKCNPEDIICPTDIDSSYRFVEYKEDKMDVQHFTDKWHWFSYAGYSQFIDSMCLYARLRKVSGRESSYALNDIAAKVLGRGKIKFGEITNHWYAQNYKFLDYIAYNINDVILTKLMDDITTDLNSLINLSGVSLLSQFSRQTVMLRNDAYEYGRAYGKVPAAAGTNMFTEYDKLQLKAGGAVLPPNKAAGVTVPVLEEGNIPSQVAIMAVDCDYSSMYPTTISSFNISKETALSTVIRINGYDQRCVEDLFSMISQPDINAIPICHSYFNLPSYQEMDTLFSKGLSR